MSSSAPHSLKVKEPSPLGSPAAKSVGNGAPTRCTCMTPAGAVSPPTTTSSSGASAGGWRHAHRSACPEQRRDQVGWAQERRPLFDEAIAGGGADVPLFELGDAELRGVRGIAPQVGVPADRDDIQTQAAGGDLRREVSGPAAVVDGDGAPARGLGLGRRGGQFGEGARVLDRAGGCDRIDDLVGGVRPGQEPEPVAVDLRGVEIAEVEVRRSGRHFWRRLAAAGQGERRDERERGGQLHDVASATHALCARCAPRVAASSETSPVVAVGRTTKHVSFS